MAEITIMIDGVEYIARPKEEVQEQSILLRRNKYELHVKNSRNTRRRAGRGI